MTSASLPVPFSDVPLHCGRIRPRRPRHRTDPGTAPQSHQLPTRPSEGGASTMTNLRHGLMTTAAAAAAALYFVLETAGSRVP